MRARLIIVVGLGLAGCFPFDDARNRCFDAGRCSETSEVDGGFDDGGQGEVDGGCALKFDGAAWVCPVRFDNPMHGSVYVLNQATAAEAWCVEHGFLAVDTFTDSGRRQCYHCLYQGGSVGYGFVVTWAGAFDSCDNCGCVTSVTCY